MRPDLSRVQYEGIFELVSLENVLSLFRGVAERKPLVQGIVDYRNLRFREPEDIDQIFFCGFRNGEHVLRAFHDSFGLQITSIVLKL